MKKTVAVRTLETQLEYIENSIAELRVRQQSLQAQIQALQDVRDNIRMNIEAHIGAGK